MKTVLITGSGKRLGAVMARHLCTRGWTPVLHYHSSGDDAEKLAAELNTVALQANLQDLDGLEGLISAAHDATGKSLAALVNSASIFEHDRPDTVSETAMEKHFRTNTMAPVLLSRAFAAQASTEDNPSIVNILDQKLNHLHPDHFSYTLSKAALSAATTMMAQDFAPHIRVNAVAPGYTLPAPGETEEDFLAKASRANPLGRRLDPLSIAEAVLFCLESTAVTGQILYADNGEHIAPTARDITFLGD